jgi:hypothetical protein
MEIERTHSDLVEFDQAAEAYKKRNKDENVFMYDLLINQRRLKKMNTTIQKKVTRITLKYCLKSESANKAILKDTNKEPMFDEAGQQSFNEEIEKITGDTVYHINPHYSKDIPGDLTLYEIEVFKGIVIDPAQVDERTGKIISASESAEISKETEPVLQA